MRKASVIAVLLVSTLTTAGCSKRAIRPDAAANDTATAAGPAAASSTAGDSAASPAKMRRAEGPTAPLLAYAHAFDLELPARTIRSTMARHEAACVEAGPTVCQVVGSDLQEDRGALTGMLKLQAQPMWLMGFKGRLDGDAANAGGRVRQSGTQSEDLSRSIVDSEAAIRAKVALRDRLQQLLARHPGKLADLLEVERQLSDVQGEIDAARSELEVMRTRVQTSSLTLQYTSLAAPVSGRAVEPLKTALGGAFAATMQGFALLVTATAVLAPFALVGGPLWLLWRRRQRRPGAVGRLGPEAG